MTQDSVRQVAEAIKSCLLTARGAKQVSALLEPEIKGLKLVLDPTPEALPTDAFRSVLGYWRSLPQAGGVPNVLRVEPSELIAMLGYLMLIDIDDENDDYRYALYGSKVAQTSGFDLTGKSLWQGRTSRSIQIFTAACYVAARQLRLPVYSVHEPPPSMTLSHWHRLILPLGREGEIKRFLVCNVPMLDGKVL